MCYPVRCDRCSNVTWSGCGMHADQVMASVPQDQHCTCR
jgi:hypothetical protein